MREFEVEWFVLGVDWREEVGVGEREVERMGGGVRGGREGVVGVEIGGACAVVVVAADVDGGRRGVACDDWIWRGFSTTVDSGLCFADPRAGESRGGISDGRKPGADEERSCSIGGVFLVVISILASVVVVADCGLFCSVPGFDGDNDEADAVEPANMPLHFRIARLTPKTSPFPFSTSIFSCNE